MQSACVHLRRRGCMQSPGTGTGTGTGTELADRPGLNINAGCMQHCICAGDRHMVAGALHADIEREYKKKDIVATTRLGGHNHTPWSACSGGGAILI
jgi:hypothetical protein